MRINMKHIFKAKQALIKTASAHLKSQSPENQILQLRESNTSLNKRLKLGIVQSVKTKSLQLGSYSQQLNAVSPLATLERGYSIVRDNQGRIIKNSSQLRPGEVINAKLHVGELNAKVTEVIFSDDTSKEK